MSRADELAATLRELAAGEEDYLLADALIGAAQQVELVKDAQLRNHVQGTLGMAQIAINGRLDALLNIGRDTHQLVVAVQHEQREQGTAVYELRADFQAIGERVTGLELGQTGIIQRLDAKRARLADDEARIEALEAAQRADRAEIERLSAHVAGRPSPEQARATYDGVQRIMQHLGLSDDDHAA